MGIRSNTVALNWRAYHVSITEVTHFAARRHAHLV
jgi:hypothetical protein